METPPTTIQLGMFIMPVHDPAKALAKCFDEDLELIVRCEELGFQEVWIGEHHSSMVENIVSPEIFIARALGLTKTIRRRVLASCAKARRRGFPGSHQS